MERSTVQSCLAAPAFPSKNKYFERSVPKRSISLEDLGAPLGAPEERNSHAKVGVRAHRFWCIERRAGARQVVEVVLRCNRDAYAASAWNGMSDQQHPDDLVDEQICRSDHARTDSDQSLQRS
jgi:hypothetical protein